METAILESLYHWFGDYVQTFYSDDAEIQPKVLEKEKHSLIVAGLNRDLARSLGLDAAETQLAEAIGLCHDVGRFRQVTVYRTFRDRDSVDHGRLGVEELLAAGIDGRLEPRDWEALAFAVRWHNAAAVPGQPDARLALHSKLIRDTDKLDICRVLPPSPPADGCSPGLENEFLAGNLLYYEDIKTTDDRKLVMLSWLFDVNFPWTIRELAARGHIDRLLDALPPSAALPAIRRKVALFLAENASRQD